MAFGIIVVQLLLAATVTGIQGQFQQYDELTDPNPTLCYEYNYLSCKDAQTPEEKEKFCNLQTVECLMPPTPRGGSACIAVWFQTSPNHTRPEHTDHTLENTLHMSCMPYGGLNDKLEVCDYDCVANSRQMFNETTGQWSTTCCCVGSLCNSPEGRSINISVAENEVPVDINPSAVAPSNGRRNTYILVAGVVIGGILTVIVVMVVCYIRKRGKSPPPAEECQTEESSCQEEVDLMEANLSLQTKVAQGRYAEVYRGGTINGVDIAIKCFAAQHRKMWHDEKEIYKLPGMGNHENITRFFGAMQNGNNGNAGTMWIVIQYYPKGSIYDYLKGHILSWPDMLKIAHSMMKGLAFLHDEVYAADGHKHTMAHRDIKSKNILIKENMTAAIADFGLTQVFSDGCVNESSVQFQAGTHRYMAPEVLDGAISFTKDSFMRIDVYAAALVMWELLTRCEIAGNNEYKAPYEEMQDSRYPTLLEMLQVVVSKEKRRPSFPECLHRHPHAPTIINTIEETWDADSEARLSAGCVESRLEILLSSLNDNTTEVNNIRNLEPPPYNTHMPEDDSAIPLIAYA